MKLEKGRPADSTGREDKELRVYDFLDHLGISYLRIDHEPAFTIDACEEIDKVMELSICKNLFLCNSQKDQFFLLMMPGHKKFKTKEISRQINSTRLSFAPEEFMEEFLDILPGSVSVLGLMNDHENRVQLLVDRDLQNETYLGCHPCVNTSSLKLKTQEILDLFLTAVGHPVQFVSLEEQ